MSVWQCGFVTMWLCDYVADAGLCVCVAVWLCGFVALWLCYCEAVWLCDYVAVWLCGCVTVRLTLDCVSAWPKIPFGFVDTDTNNGARRGNYVFAEAIFFSGF